MVHLPHDTSTPLMREVLTVLQAPLVRFKYVTTKAENIKLSSYVPACRGGGVGSWTLQTSTAANKLLYNFALKA